MEGTPDEEDHTVEAAARGPEAADGAGRLRRAERQGDRDGRVRCRLHDRLRHLGQHPRPARRRPLDDERDGRACPQHRPGGRRAGAGRRRHRLRQPAQHPPHGQRVRAGGRLRHPARGPGLPQAVRAHAGPQGDRDGGDGPEDQGRDRRPPGRGLRHHCPHGCSHQLRPRGGAPPRAGLPRRRGRRDFHRVRPRTSRSSRRSTRRSAARPRSPT